MATPAVVPADLGLKALFLTAQIDEFEHLDRRYTEALLADLRRLFPMPAERGPGTVGRAGA